MNTKTAQSPVHVTGIHHITAIAGDPQENVDFYAGVLGLRLVKRSINQDAPDTYHLFFADGKGNPGTDMTFFPWPKMNDGRIGSGVWGEVGFIVPPGSLDWWEKRIGSVYGTQRRVRFGEESLVIHDPHGMALALTEAPTDQNHLFSPWSASPVPDEYQIRGLGSMTLTIRSLEATTDFIGSSFGFEHSATEGAYHRYVVGAGLGGQRIDLFLDPEASRGTWGTGSVHHVAFRVPDSPAQRTVDSQIQSAGGASSGVIDRFWFQSVYVREPSGALCEVATDGPGFAVDEDPEHLGESLVLPPWYEAQRGQIESILPEITLPGQVGASAASDSVDEQEPRDSVVTGERTKGAL